jgi:hypothetical protein
MSLIREPSGVETMIQKLRHLAQGAFETRIAHRGRPDWCNVRVWARTFLLAPLLLSMACSGLLHCKHQRGAAPDQASRTPDRGSRKEAGPAPDGHLVTPNPGRKVYYVRPGGGDARQCNGLVNTDYPGKGSGQACALSHPFFALPPGGKPLLQGGDTLFIARGAYRMGFGAPGDGGCDEHFTWDCKMPPVPSGPGAEAPTRILGEGYNRGCPHPPSLWGAERAWQIIDLTGSNHVQLQCLELTDRSSCVVSHQSPKHRCQRDRYPHGDWAPAGIAAAKSSDVLLKQLNIHGLAHSGIQAGQLKDWTLEDVQIVGNGWAGWDGDINTSHGSSKNSGKLTFRRVTIAHNGCGETYPGGQPTGCWSQTAGGYGDGLGTAATGGDWLFEDCKVLHNTSDGLDLLYHTLGGSITIRRLRAEGNAGNQVKVTGDATIENSVLVGNCGYFDNQPFTHQVDPCRAMGNTISLSLVSGSRMTLCNNSVYGQGDVLVSAGPREGHSCDGSERVVALNNVFVGDREYHNRDDRAALFYQEGCPQLKFQHDYGVVYGVKPNAQARCPVGSHDLCQDPRLGRLSGDAFDMVPRPGSPAIDSGLPVGGPVPAVDILGHRRPSGEGVDRGAFEVGAK